MEEMGPLLSGTSYRNSSGYWGASWEGVYNATLEDPGPSSHSTSRHACHLNNNNDIHRDGSNNNDDS